MENTIRNLAWHSLWKNIEMDSDIRKVKRTDEVLGLKVGCTCCS